MRLTAAKHAYVELSNADIAKYLREADAKLDERRRRASGPEAAVLSTFHPVACPKTPSQSGKTGKNPVRRSPVKPATEERRQSDAGCALRDAPDGPIARTITSAAAPSLHDAIINPDLPGAVDVLRAAVAAKRKEIFRGRNNKWNRRHQNDNP